MMSIYFRKRSLLYDAAGPAPVEDNSGEQNSPELFVKLLFSSFRVFRGDMLTQFNISYIRKL